MVPAQRVSSRSRFSTRPTQSDFHAAVLEATAVANSLVRRLAGWLPLLLLGIGLLLLQLSFLGKSLLFTLPSYSLIAAAAAIAFARLRTNPLPDRACLCFTAIFAGYIVLRALTSPAPYLARTDLLCALGALAVYAVTVTALRDSSRRIALLGILFAFALYHILAGLVQFGVGQNFIALPFLSGFAVTSRASGLYANPDHFAGLLEMLGVFALSLACWSRRPRLSRVLFAYLALACYIALALTGSRGGYLSAAASLIIFGILSSFSLRSGDDPVFRKYRNIAILIALVAILGGVFWIQQSPAVRERVTTIVAPDQTRFDLWRAAVTQWKLQPIIGTGSATYRFYGREFRVPRMQADPVVVHNDYLHLLCEYGLLGVAAFCLFFGAHLRAGWKAYRRFGPERLAAGNLPSSDRLALTIGALSALAACVVHSAVDFNLHVPANALLVAFIFGILAGQPRLRSPQPAEQPVSLAPLALRLAGTFAAVLLLFQCVRLLPGEYFAEGARVELQNENPAAAIAFADKALVYEQNNPNIYFYLGRALGALADDKRQSEKRASYYEAAIGAFDHARQLVPLDGTYPLDAAFAYDNMGRFSEAEWMYTLARARDPHSVVMSHLYQHHLALWRTHGTQILAADSGSQ